MKPQESALQVRGLTKRFDRLAVDALDLTVRSGEFYALVGPNGAGKTTTLRMVAGLLRPDAGSVSVFGIDALADPVAAKQIMAWVSDEPMIYDKLTPLEYLEFVAGLWGIDPAISEPAAHHLLVSLGLEPHLHERCEGFSKGMRQKVALAGALVHDPRLIILDEPLTGLDAVSARHVKGLLGDRVRAGCTVIMTTHILEVAERMADRIGVIAAGRLVAEGTLGRTAPAERPPRHQPRRPVHRAGRCRGRRGMSSATALTWFARHEIRLAWREWLAMMTGGRRKRTRAVIGLIVFAAIMHLPAYAVIGRFADLQAPLDKSSLIVMTATILLAWALMLSQAIESVTRVFYARADLDLIMSSPVRLDQRVLDPHRRDRAVGDRDGAVVVDALRRRARDRRRHPMVRGLRRRRRHRPVGRGDCDRGHDPAVSPDRPEPYASGGANSRRHHRRRLRHRAADRRHPVLRHAVALRGADLGRRGGIRA